MKEQEKLILKSDPRNHDSFFIFQREYYRNITSECNFPFCICCRQFLTCNTLCSWSSILNCKLFLIFCSSITINMFLSWFLFVFYYYYFNFTIWVGWPGIKKAQTQRFQRLIFSILRYFKMSSSLKNGRVFLLFGLSCNFERWIDLDSKIKIIQRINKWHCHIAHIPTWSGSQSTSCYFRRIKGEEEENFKVVYPLNLQPFFYFIIYIYIYFSIPSKIVEI